MRGAGSAAALLLAAPIVFLGAGWEAALQPFNTIITASLLPGSLRCSLSTAVIGGGT